MHFSLRLTILRQTAFGLCGKAALDSPHAGATQESNGKTATCPVAYSTDIITESNSSRITIAKINGKDGLY